MDGSQGAPDGAETLVGVLAVSADSHITEPPNLYRDFIDPAFRERAPYVARDPEKGGEGFYIEGFARPVALGLLAAAGRDPQTIKLTDTSFEDLHRSGWDPAYRIADQERDGVQAEFLYPTVGMLICNHPDGAYKNACGWAYNRWLQAYVAGAPGRLYGLGQIFMISPQQAIADLRKIKDMGFKGVMMPGDPAVEDYDSKIYDPVWATAVELNLPLSFHILTTKSGSLAQNPRGPRINSFLSIIRGNQDIIGTLIFGGVFDRHPDLKVVCVEADAGWAPHYMYRMDHAYKRHRYWMKAPPLERLPSDYFRQNIYMTFQDDWVAFKTTGLVNPRRLMWASDFPHSDSTWPNSQAVIEEQTATLTEDQRNWICHDNVAELYGLTVN